MGAAPGFALVELLPIKAVLVTLIGLLLPPVQQVRTTAGMLECAEELRPQLAAFADKYEASLRRTERELEAAQRAGRDVDPQQVEKWLAPLSSLAGEARARRAEVDRLIAAAATRSEGSCSQAQLPRLRELQGQLELVAREADGASQKAREELRKLQGGPEPAAGGGATTAGGRAPSSAFFVRIDEATMTRIAIPRRGQPPYALGVEIPEQTVRDRRVRVVLYPEGDEPPVRAHGRLEGEIEAGQAAYRPSVDRARYDATKRALMIPLASDRSQGAPGGLPRPFIDVFLPPIIWCGIEGSPIGTVGFEEQCRGARQDGPR